MVKFWEVAVQPILEATKSNVIAEVGVARGIQTKRILQYCVENNKCLHAVDPKPQFDVDEFKKVYGDAFIFHKGYSLDVLQELPKLDAALMDGDHNWYTVYHELLLIEKPHIDDPVSFPILFFHDIAWPYGRRDLYYDPATVPEEFRQHYDKQGLYMGEKGFAQDNGLNSMFCNAIEEGGERNGVLTGIEDFIKQSKIEFELINIPYNFGLGIIIAKDRIRNEPRLQQALDHLTSAEGMRELLEHFEFFRLHTAIRDQVRMLGKEKWNRQKIKDGKIGQQ
jgi:hypothetical protein